MSYLSNSTRDANDLGYFATPAALMAAYPVGYPGAFALVGSTDTIWVWDENTMMWVDSGTKSTTIEYLVASATAPAATKNLANYICDGVNDDVEINAAITAILAAGTGGGKVTLSEGQFNLNASINLSSSYLNIEGQGIGATLLKTQAASNANVFNLSGTGTIHLSIRRMQIDCNRANNTFGSGIHINTPWQNYDAEHIFEDLLITNCNNNGVEAAANADTRAMFFSRVHVKGVSGNGFYFPWPSITDSIFEDCIADTVALNGFYQGGANNHHLNCKMFYCGSTAGSNHGFNMVGYNNYYENCEAQDNYQSGFYGDIIGGDPTYRNFGCTFVNCIADSNNQNNNATYGCGFQGVGVKQWQIIGGISMTRPYPSFTQRVGISFSGGADQNYVNGTFLFSNTTNYSDTSTGNNVFMRGPGQSDNMNWESTGVLNLRHFGAKGDGKRYFGAVASSASTTVTCSAASFTSADVGKKVLIYSEGNYGGITTIASVTNATTIVLAANAGVTTNSSNGYIIYGTDDSTLIQKILTYASSFVQPGSLSDPNQPAGSGQVTVFLPGDATQSLYILASQITIPVGVVLKADGHLANFLPSRNAPCILMQAYTGIERLELENLGGTAIYAGSGGSQASIYLGDIKIWHGQGSGLKPLSPAATPAITGGSLSDGTYYYVITSIDSSGGETTVSAEVSATITGGTGHGSVALTWTALAGTVTYRIYRGTATKAENVYYTSATNSFTDTGAASTSLYPTPPGYALTLDGYLFDIRNLFVKECTMGVYHKGGSDASIENAFLIGCGTPIRMNGTNQANYNHVFFDTCGGSGIGGLIIDNGCNDITIQKLQTFSIYTVGPITMSPVINIGPYSSLVNGYITVNFQANNEGGAGLSIANARDVYVNMDLSNFVGTNTNQTNPFTTGVIYGTGLAAEISITGVLSTGITPFTGTQVGTFTYQQNDVLAGSSSLTVGTTTIAGGSTGRIEYNNGGVLGEMTTTGSGTVVALATSPSFTTPSLGAATATSLDTATINHSGTININNSSFAGVQVGGNLAVGSTSTTAFVVGASTAQPAFRVSAATGQTNGIIVTGNASGTGANIGVIGTSTNDPLTIDAKGSGTINLGSVSTGAVQVNGVTIATVSGTQTLTNKRVTRRLVTTTQSATPAINSDNTDVSNITGLAQAITSMTSSLTGTPVDGDLLEIRITDNGTARAITWGASFGSTTVTLPTTTVISTMLRVYLEWNATASLWQCVQKC
jgi:hypothetical protein